MPDEETVVDAPAASGEEAPGVEAPPFDEDAPVVEGSISSDEPIVAPDGHVNLSADDIKARAAAAGA